MSTIAKKYIPMGIMLILGVFLFAEFYLSVPKEVSDISQAIQNYTVIIAGFAMGIGAINLLFTHIRPIQKREPGKWFYSLWLLLVMVVFTAIGLGFGTSSTAYQFLFNNFYVPNDQTIYSLIGFMVVYAIYLTFRARNWETTYLLVLAFIALLGNSPIGPAVFPPLTGVQSWLSSVPNAASVRGFNIAMSIGAIVVGLRTIMGRERAALGG